MSRAEPEKKSEKVLTRADACRSGLLTWGYAFGVGSRLDRWVYHFVSPKFSRRQSGVGRMINRVCVCGHKEHWHHQAGCDGLHNGGCEKCVGFQESEESRRRRSWMSR